MLIGYVSDERYVALAGVRLEFLRAGTSREAFARASGAVHVDPPLEPGRYEVVLQHPGHGAKRSWIDVPPAAPIQFRLLSDQLLGYVWPKWCRAGGQGEFRVHSPEAYHLELWLHGWRRELVRSLGWFDEHGPRATVQVTPDGDYTQTGVHWNEQGYSNPHHRQYATAPARSGLYYFHARTARGEHFSFPWIVASREPTSPIAVLASNITWNLYNNFGGRSNYINPAALPLTPTVNARFDLARYTEPGGNVYDTECYAPLSFERPEPINVVGPTEEATDPIEGRSACHLAPAEWRLLAWLEREGFAYDYYAETQLHAEQVPLDHYRVLILSTHPEYWSASMYRQVKTWVFGRGGRLMYLGGNGLNALVEFDDSGAVLVKNGDTNRQKDAGLESRFHDKLESEGNLLGVVFTDAGVMTSAPFRVLDGGHWAFAGTGLKTGELFGVESLHRRCPGGASGHETDKISRFAPAGVVRLAKGTNVDDGGADLILFPTPSGGCVFSAGSITYPASLLVDEPLSRVTKNVLAEFLRSA